MFTPAHRMSYSCSESWWPMACSHQASPNLSQSWNITPLESSPPPAARGCWSFCRRAPFNPITNTYCLCALWWWTLVVKPQPRTLSCRSMSLALKLSYLEREWKREAEGWTAALEIFSRCHAVMTLARSQCCVTLAKAKCTTAPIKALHLNLNVLWYHGDLVRYVIINQK